MIYIFLAQGFEEVEALATVDVLRRAGLQVKMVGVGGGTVTGSHGIPVVCDLTDDAFRSDDMEMLLLPGGLPGTTNLEASPVVQAALDVAVRRQLWIGAICAAPSILGHRGLLEGKRAICAPGWEPHLAGATLAGDYVVTDGKITTAKGMGVAVDFGVRLVGCLLGEEKAADLRATLQCRY